MELTAVLEILRSLPPEQPLLIEGDSLYVVDAFTKWLPGWRERNMRTAEGKPVAHRELIETIAGPLNGRDIGWEKVKIHSEHALNDMADCLAGLGRIAAKRFDQTYCFSPASLTDQPPKDQATENLA